jgi:oxygen-dependent protoporphyrinogen oxidase
VTVTRICRNQDNWTVNADNGRHWPADVVALTCPAPEQARILADLDSKLQEAIAAIPFNRIAVVALGYQENSAPNVPSGFGYIVPQRSRRDLLGVQWCSAIFPDRAPNGCVLWRALCGGWQRGDVVDWDDDRLLAAVRKELQQALNVTAQPIFHHVQRWPMAIPQYHIGHLDRVAKIEAQAAKHPGLFLAGNAYHGVAMNDCTEQAEILARRIGEFVAARTNGR